MGPFPLLTEDVAIKAKCPVKVGNGEVDVADFCVGVDFHRQIVTSKLV